MIPAGVWIPGISSLTPYADHPKDHHPSPGPEPRSAQLWPGTVDGGAARHGARAQLGAGADRVLRGMMGGWVGYMVVGNDGLMVVQSGDDGWFNGI